MTVDVEALLRNADLVGLIGRAVKLARNGREWEGLCPFHKEKTPSFRVVPDKGFYHCFGCGAHGDAIDFVMHYDRVDWKEAAARLSSGNVGSMRPREQGPAPEPVDIYAGFRAASPPADAIELFRPGRMTPRLYNPKRENWGQFAPALVHPYRTAAGELVGFVLRRDLGEGRKETPQIRYVATPDGELVWARVPFAEPRPLYGLDLLAAAPDAPVMVVEGEKAADRARGMGSPYVAVTWSGGSGAYARTDWAPLKGRKVLLVPDADGPGLRAMLGWRRDSGEPVKGIADLAFDAGAAEVKAVRMGWVA